MNKLNWPAVILAIALAMGFAPPGSRADDGASREDAVAALRKAAAFYRTRVASHGGYVYYYSVDLRRRWGEGEAGPDQIWVQPPGTPAVGMAFLKAYEATGDRSYLDAAREAAEALVYGQLRSGGWTNAIDFDPRGSKVALYRNGKGRGHDNSTLDDGISQAALRLLMHVDRAFGFAHEGIHESARVALEALLEAQFPNGGFPQVWTGPVPRQPVVKASYSDRDWRTEGKVKEYWRMYTLNDNVAGYALDALKDAHDIYQDERCEAALIRLGDFLILAQMPDPQPAWAQQYDYDMHPIWARKFEPPAIAGRESQDVIEALLKLYKYTGREKYLEPIPRAVEYLRRSLLADGRLSRYYELKTNRPLYMTGRGDSYELTYDDSDLPAHYGWKWASRLDEFEREYAALKGRGPRTPDAPSREDLGRRALRAIRDLDDQGRWISTYRDDRIVGQPKFKPDYRYISSEVFSRNVEALSEYLIATE
jgi:PelA/Pel-15E family pectate lyase